MGQNRIGMLVNLSQLGSRPKVH